MRDETRGRRLPYEPRSHRGAHGLGMASCAELLRMYCILKRVALVIIYMTLFF